MAKPSGDHTPLGGFVLKEVSRVSDIAQLKVLGGRPVTFLRFHGPDKYVVHIDGEERTISRHEWQKLVTHPSCSDADKPLWVQH
jgi:hypothetical protein